MTIDGSTPTRAATALIVMPSKPRSMSSFLAAERMEVRVAADLSVKAMTTIVGQHSYAPFGRRTGWRPLGLAPQDGEGALASDEHRHGGTLRGAADNPAGPGG
jgi:hypothetical protein